MNKYTTARLSSVRHRKLTIVRRRVQFKPALFVITIFFDDDRLLSIIIFSSLSAKSRSSDNLTVSSVQISDGNATLQ